MCSGPKPREGAAEPLEESVTDLARRPESSAQEAEQLDRLFDRALDLLCIVDAHGRFLRVSRAWEGALGYRPEELRVKRCIDFVHPEDAEPTRAAFAELRAGTPLLNFVNRYRHKDGTYRWLEWRAAPFLGPCTYASAREISGRKQAEEERGAHLRFLENLDIFDRAIRQTDDLERMMDSGLSTALSIFECDRAWLLFPCDPDAPSWTVPMERTRAQYPGAFAQGTVVPTTPDVGALFQEALAHDGPLAFDARSGRHVPTEVADRFSVRSQVLLAVHPKLGKPWVLGMHQCSYARIWTDEDLRLFGEIGRRMADALSSLLLLKHLRESEEKHKLLIEATNTAFVILDTDGRVTDANQEYLRLTGRREPRDIIGRHASEWAAEHDRERCTAAIAQCVDSGSIRNLEIDFAGLDGRITPVEANATMLSTSKWTRIMAVCRDISERRRAEDLVRETARRKDEFLAMLGHELRNPLAPIRAATYVLHGVELSDPRARKALEVIDRQTAHMARIVDDLLDVSRIERGMVSLRREPLDWAAIVRNAAEDSRSVLEAKGITMKLLLPDGPLWVDGDPTRLAQVLGNLFHNAGKFTRAGGTVTIGLRPVPSEKAAVLTVADTGIGMSDETLGRLFEPFGQGSTDLARSAGGLGLGLALARGLLWLHGGTIRAESRGPGRGSRFTVEIPLIEPASHAPPSL